MGSGVCPSSRSNTSSPHARYRRSTCFSSFSSGQLASLTVVLGGLASMGHPFGRLRYRSPVNHQPSTINHQPSTIDHRPSTTSHQPTATCSTSPHLSPSAPDTRSTLDPQPYPNPYSRLFSCHRRASSTRWSKLTYSPLYMIMVSEYYKIYIFFLHNLLLCYITYFATI